jgi:hypothetical protein
MQRSLPGGTTLALLSVTLAVLIAAPVFAQNAPPTLAPPATKPPSTTQSRQHFVPQHVTRDGKYVAPHYEATQPTPFRGYFADQQAARERQKQHGYHEPAPDYTTPEDYTGRHMEGR